MAVAVIELQMDDDHIVSPQRQTEQAECFLRRRLDSENPKVSEPFTIRFRVIP